MPTWGEILPEFDSPAKADSVRRKYLSQLAQHTQRDTILYSTKWTEPSGVSPDVISITEEDIQGFMEVVHGLQRKELDLIIHSPGGSPVATEAIVKYLRKKFTAVRIIVPQGAMSAGTMLACAGESIVMGKHSFLGPIDPQFILPTHIPGANRAVPAQAILDQFDLAKKECKDNQNLGPWLPILNQYGPGLLIECKNAIDLSKKLVREWLAKYMFHGSRHPSHKASIVARRLAAHKDHKSHARHLDRDDCKRIGLIIDDLEQDQSLQDLVLSVFHASTLTFNVTPTAKIIENQNGKAFIKLSGMLKMIRQQPQTPPSSHPRDIPQRIQ